MEEIKFSETNNFNTEYDKEADVLYISFGEPRESETIDTGENLMIRIDIKTGAISGFTITNFSIYGKEIEEIIKLQKVS